MKKKYLSIFIIMTIMILNLIPTIVKAAPKEVWIDNTVDNSTTRVIGILKVNNTKTGEEEVKKLRLVFTSLT